MNSEFTPIPIKDLKQNIHFQNDQKRFWKKMKMIDQHQFASHANFLVFNQKKKSYFFGFNNNIMNFNMKTKTILKSWSKEDSIIKCLRIRKEGQLCGFSTNSGEVKILSLPHKTILKSFKFSNQPVFCIDLLEALPHLAIGGDNGSLEIKDFTTESTIASFPLLHSDCLRRCIFVPTNPSLVITGGLDKKINIVDIRDSNKNAISQSLDFEVTDITYFVNHQFISTQSKQLKIWDLRNLDKSVFVANVGSKTISGVKYLHEQIYVSSFDGGLRIAKFDGSEMHFTGIKNFKNPIVNFDVGFSSDEKLKSIAISTADGNFRIFSKENETKNAKSQQQEFGNIEEFNLARLLSKGMNQKEMSSYQFFNRGKWGVPKHHGIKISKPKLEKNSSYEKHLRKFQYDKALSEVLKINDSNLILSLMEELLVRNSLEQTFKQLDEDNLKKMAAFFLKKLDSPNSQRIVVHCVDLFLQSVSELILSSSILNSWVNKIGEKLETEIKNSERACFIQSYFDLI